MRSAVLVALMALVTMGTRFLPFIIFRRQTPPFIRYLGRVLPAAIIGMLVIYCLRDVDLLHHPFGIPELAASACVVCIQVFRRNSLLSILSGTLLYMVLVQTVFA